MKSTGVPGKKERAEKKKVKEWKSERVNILSCLPDVRVRNRLPHSILAVARKADGTPGYCPTVWPCLGVTRVGAMRDQSGSIQVGSGLYTTFWPLITFVCQNFKSTLCVDSSINLIYWCVIAQNKNNILQVVYSETMYFKKYVITEVFLMDPKVFAHLHCTCWSLLTADLKADNEVEKKENR